MMSFFVFKRVFCKNSIIPIFIYQLANIMWRNFCLFIPRNPTFMVIDTNIGMFQNIETSPVRCSVLINVPLHTI